MQPSIPEPVFINVEYLFFLVARFLEGVFSLEFLEKLRIFGTVLLILIIAFVLYLLVRLHELQQEDKKKKLIAASAAAISVPTASTVSPGGQATVSAERSGRNETWEGIRAKLLSDSQSDWRLGIIEADIYMDQLLDQKGYHGDTTGDKLKQILPGDLASIQIAWEAHKIRNRIAHDGSAFTLTQPEARRTLSYFEIVFRDLGAIE